MNITKEIQKHIGYFEYLYFKYMFRDSEISDNSKRIIKLLKQDLTEELKNGYRRKNTTDKKLSIRYP